MLQNYAVNHQFVLNNRWLFDATQDRLVDLEGHLGDTVLKPVVTRILTLFVRSPHIVLRRAQLLDDGWRAFGFEVCENSLSQVMCSLRSTFETIDPGKQYIKTIPRIGYCLLAVVRPATTEDMHTCMAPVHDVPPAAQYVAPTTAGPKHPVSLFTFDEIVEDEWRRAQRDEVPLSMLMIEIAHCDDFSGVVESAIDNNVMASITECVVQHIHRARDHAARYEGNVFALLLPETGDEGAAMIGERIRASVQALGSRQLAGASPTMTVSIGVACTTLSYCETPQAFIEAAFGALHEIRSVGGARAGRGAVAIELAA